jgi:2-oxoisovalerate dehydrogenase E1 component beta subunit
MTPQRPAPLAESINATLVDLLEHDPRMLLMGQDIGRLGGVFRVTRGLQERFGADRVRDSLLAESSLVGQAIGMAMSGLVPVCEMQFAGFAYPAVNQLLTQAARIGTRWNGAVEIGMVVRIPSGGGTRGVEHHNDSNEALFSGAPGLCVACPSTGEDYDQILRYAVGLGSPVVIYEPIRLYWRRIPQHVGAEPSTSPTSARIIRRGTDVTVATYGALTHDVVLAARELSPDVDVEVVDLRWVAPLDTDTVLESVARTGRLLVVHESTGPGGIGAEVAAVVAERGFDTLRCPVRRLAPARRQYPPADREHEYLISKEQIKKEILVLKR